MLRKCQGIGTITTGPGGGGGAVGSVCGKGCVNGGVGGNGTTGVGAWERDDGGCN